MLYLKHKMQNRGIVLYAKENAECEDACATFHITWDFFSCSSSSFMYFTKVFLWTWHFTLV